MTGVFEGVGTLQFSPDNKLSYAYSGAIAASTTIATVLDFQTNSEYQNVRVSLCGTVDIDTPAIGDGSIMACEILFNDIRVAFLKSDSRHGSDQVQSPSPLPLIIPPFTHVVCKVLSNEDTANELGALLFTGEVSGAIEQQNLEAITNNNKWASK